MMYRFFVMAIITLSATTLLAQTEPQKRLSLQDAINTALERNLDLQMERLNVNTGNLDVSLTKARYEPTVTGGVGTSESKNAAQNTTEGAAGTIVTSSDTDWSAGIQKSEWWGFDWNMNFSSLLRSSNSASSLGSLYGSGLSVGFSQDLLKGFSRDKEIMLYDEYVAISNWTNNKADLETRIISVIESVENAYWEMVLSREQLEVNRTSLRLAQTLLEQNKTKVDVGTLPPIELVNAEAQIANRQREIVTAENNVRASEDVLKKVLNLPVEEWDHRLIPTDRINLEDIETNFQKDLETALANRTEMRKNREDMRRAMLDVKLRKNDKRPELTFSGGYSYSGTSTAELFTTVITDPATGLPIRDADGDIIEVPTGVGDPTYREALSNLLSRDEPTWNLRLALSWQPFNKTNKINIAKANVAMRRQELAIAQTRLNIMEDVRGAVRDISANKKAIAASEVSVKLSRKNLEAEQQKFQNGLVTNYSVSEKQKDLVQEETNLIQTKINYVKAVVAYHKALGRLLERRKINIQ